MGPSLLEKRSRSRRGCPKEARVRELSDCVYLRPWLWRGATRKNPKKNPIMVALLFRGMLLNKHVNRAEQLPCRAWTKHQSGWKCQEFVAWMEPRRGTTGVDVHRRVTGTIPGLSFTAGSLIAFSGWRRLEMLRLDPVRKDTWPGFGR